jgi:hypothetical protein
MITVVLQSDYSVVVSSTKKNVPIGQRTIIRARVSILNKT